MGYSWTEEVRWSDGKRNGTGDCGNSKEEKEGIAARRRKKMDNGIHSQCIWRIRPNKSKDNWLFDTSSLEGTLNKDFEHQVCSIHCEFVIFLLIIIIVIIIILLSKIKLYVCYCWCLYFNWLWLFNRENKIWQTMLRCLECRNYSPESRLNYWCICVTVYSPIKLRHSECTVSKFSYLFKIKQMNWIFYIHPKMVLTQKIGYLSPTWHHQLLRIRILYNHWLKDFLDRKVFGV